MNSYLDLLRKTLKNGVVQKNRTGIDTIMIPGGMMQFDLAEGFPILTTKKVAFNQVVGELLGFIRGYDNAKDFRALGCTIWDANANKNEAWLKNPVRMGEDDLGRIYGVQWRDWKDGDRYFDQLGAAIDTIMNDPTSRRIVVSAWNPTQLRQMALPPCHYAFQFLLEQERRALHCCMTMRSCDMFLGVPFNISSYALLLSLVAKATGCNPGTLTMFLSDVHIYENHVLQVKELLTRSPRSRPDLRILENYKIQAVGPLQWLEQVEPSDISLINYDPWPAIKAEMAV